MNKLKPRKSDKVNNGRIPNKLGIVEEVISLKSQAPDLSLTGPLLYLLCYRYPVISIYTIRRWLNAPIKRQLKNKRMTK